MTPVLAAAGEGTPGGVWAPPHPHPVPCPCPVSLFCKLHIKVFPPFPMCLCSSMWDGWE